METRSDKFNTFNEPRKAGIMGHENPHLSDYYLYTSVFTTEECQQILNLSRLKDSTTLSHADKIIKILSLQKNTTTTWILKRIWEIALKTNKMYYDFDISTISESFLLECSKNSVFNWRTDIGKGSASTRKISIVLFLSDRVAYEGGQLSFRILEEYDEIKEIPQIQGNLLLFPSYLPYKITPVTRGIKYVLNTWVNGNAFC